MCVCDPKESGREENESGARDAGEEERDEDGGAEDELFGEWADEVVAEAVEDRNLRMTSRWKEKWRWKGVRCRDSRCRADRGRERCEEERERMWVARVAR